MQVTRLPPFIPDNQKQKRQLRLRVSRDFRISAPSILSRLFVTLFLAAQIRKRRV